MKELSTEQKAQRYNEALERAKGVIEQNPLMEYLKKGIEYIFPELKESEDKQHREWILEYLYDGLRKSDEQFKDHFKCAISWLEKQGEHAKFRDSIQVGDKVTRNEDGVLVNLSQLKRVAKKDEKQGEQKSFAKYKVGDTIYYNSFGRLVNFVIANIVEDGTDNPMYENKDGNSVFQNDIVEQKPADTDFSDIRTWKYIVDAVWTEKKGIGQYLDSPFTEEVAKKLQKRFGKIEKKPADKVETKLLDGVGMTRLRFSYEQIQAIEKYVKRYVEFKMNENENNDK